MRLVSLLLVSLLGLAGSAFANEDRSSSVRPGLERLDALLSGLESQRFSGAVAAGFGNGPELIKAYGLADRASGQAYRADTVQSMGSITKPVTAAAVLLLQAQGDLSLDDTLADHFGQVPDDKREITLHQLLTHSAGFPGAIGPDDEPIGSDEFLKQALATALTFKPGSDFGYSNVGYSLLGILIEKLTGQGYESFVAKRLLEPLGMDATGYVLPQWEESRRAMGYRGGVLWGEVYARGWRPEGPGWHLRANGGLHTTVEDMRLWVNLLRGNSVLDAESVARWTRAYVDEGGGDSFYAYGWAVSDSPIGRMVAHNGGNGIFSADFLWFPEHDFYLYIQGNTATVAAADLRPWLLAALIDPDFPLPSVLPTKVESTVASQLAGDWFGADGRVSLTADGPWLMAEVAGPQLLRALNNVPAEDTGRLQTFDKHTLEILARIKAGHAQVLEGFTDDDMVERSRRLSALFDRFPTNARIDLAGSLPVKSPGRFSDLAAFASYVRIETDKGRHVATVLWQDDGNYRGTALGPADDLPGLVFVPAEADSYLVVERQPPWRQQPVHIDGKCMRLESIRLCRSQASSENHE